DGIRYRNVTGVQTCALPILSANAAWVPPYGSGATLYLRPYMFASGPVIGVKPSAEYQFRLFGTPVGPYFKGGAKPITICVSDFRSDERRVGKGYRAQW